MGLSMVGWGDERLFVVVVQSRKKLLGKGS